MHELQRQRLPEVAAIRRVNSTFSGSSSAYIEAFDCMVYVNVLEHIPDDRSELRLAFEALRPPGSICVFVPALQWLMSDFDRSIGHHRRYTRHSLRQKLRDTGFVIQRDHYLDGLGIVPWLLFMKLGRAGLAARTVSTYDPPHQSHPSRHRDACSPIDREERAGHYQQSKLRRLFPRNAVALRSRPISSFLSTVGGRMRLAAQPRAELGAGEHPIQ